MFWPQLKLTVLFKIQNFSLKIWPVFCFFSLRFTPFLTWQPWKTAYLVQHIRTRERSDPNLLHKRVESILRDRGRCQWPVSSWWVLDLRSFFCVDSKRLNYYSRQHLQMTRLQEIISPTTLGTKRTKKLDNFTNKKMHENFWNDLAFWISRRNMFVVK